MLIALKMKFPFLCFQVRIWGRPCNIPVPISADTNIQTQYGCPEDSRNRIWNESSTWSVPNHFSKVHSPIDSLGSVVSIETGYRLDNWGVGIRIPVRSRILTSPALWPTQPPIQWVSGVVFSWVTAAGAWRKPFNSNYCRGQENVDLYIDSPISTSTNLPLIRLCYK
jgi:hypothetical protein